MNNPLNLVFVSSSSLRASETFEAVERLSREIGNIELTGGRSFDPELLPKLVQLRRERDLAFLIHGYFPPAEEDFILNFADSEKSTRTFITESMRFAVALGVPYYSVHAGFKKNFAKKGELLYDTIPDAKVFTMEGIKENIDWFTKIFPNVRLALENLFPNNRNTETCFLMHIDEITTFLDEEKRASLLLDLGHLKVSSSLMGFNYARAIEKLMECYGERIAEIHLSENDGNSDSHLPITSQSTTHMIVKEFAERIRKNRIILTIESRNLELDELREVYRIITTAVAT